MRESFKHTEETKRKLSEITKKQWEDGRASAKTCFKKGFKHTEESKKKISLKMRDIQKGSNNSNWKGGTTEESSRDRRNQQHKKWKISIIIRDGFICKKCLQKSKELNVHHINSYTKYPEQRYNVNNGITFCGKCHRSFHKIFGKITNQEDLIKFMCE